MNLPDKEPLPPEVLAEIERLEAQQLERKQQHEELLRTTTRNQRRVSLKLHNKKIKKHIRNLK